MTQEQDQDPDRAPNFLMGLEEVEWTPSTPIPPQLRVSNLRRRGIDEYHISLHRVDTGGGYRGLLGLSLFNIRRPVVQSITITDSQFRFSCAPTGRGSACGIAIKFTDVDVIVIRPGTMKAEPCILLSYRNVGRGNQSDFIEFGAGLPEAALVWLRDRLLLESAGLVSKPLYNVGRRSTRRTVDPDERTYLAWTSGSNRLIEMFLQEAPDKFDAFCGSVEREEWLNAARHVHWMKSGSAAVAAGYLSELFQRIEIQLQAAFHDDVRSLVQHAKSEFREVESHLRKIQCGVVLGEAHLDPQDSAAPLDASQQPFPGRRVLVVDDSLVNQELAREFIEALGCFVNCLGTGEEAVALLEHERYDIVLMDCQMPGIGGIEATRQIRNSAQMQGKRSTIIVALTAHTLPEDRKNCLAAGMNDYLGKPYSPDELSVVLDRWFKTGSGDDADSVLSEVGTPAAASAGALPEVLEFFTVDQPKSKGRVVKYGKAAIRE